MPTPKSSSTGTKVKPTVEILPDTRFIVFAGDEHEASSVKLTGRVRLNCPEAMSICKPKIRLEGVRKVSWVFLGSITSGVAEDKRVFLNEEKPLGSIESTHKVKEGSIEWPFEFELPPSLPESVEGLRDTWIVYNLYATVSRPGWNQKDILKHEHLRIVRTLGQESIETTRSRVNADIWANKLSYSISIPSDAVIFGTSITADVELSPIRKGIKLGRVEMRLMEMITKRLPSTPDGNDTRHDRSKSEEKEVTRMQMEFPETAKVTYDDETVDNPVLQDEMYKFKATLPLPKSLHKCRQDVDSHQINISHRFKLMVNIHNPEGHISQLVCRLPVKLFISPNLPINDSNEVHIHDGTQAAIDSLTATLSAPPQYGQHQLDQIFSDIDPSGYMSRAGSGPNTPAGLLAQSRRASEENLRSLNAVADMTPVHGSAAPYALAHALSNLQDADARPRMSRLDSGPSSASDTPYTQTRRSSPEHARSPPSRTRSAVVSPGGSAEGSRRASAEEQSQQYDLNSLSRVPSYNAAVRTPGPHSYGDGPPSYIDATSRPPSPRQRPAMPQVGSSGSLSMLAMRGLDEDARLRTLRAQN